MTLNFAQDTSDAIALHLIEQGEVENATELSKHARRWAKSQQFDGALGTILVVPSETGDIDSVLVGFGTKSTRLRKRFGASIARSKLPSGTYALRSEIAPEDCYEFALGWLLEGYRFDRYAKQSTPQAQLCAPKSVPARELENIARAEVLARDLINTPSQDMGPQELENSARELAKEFGANITSIRGDDLLSHNFPMIHAVGRAANRPPRLVELNWGVSGPKIALVGKGICFDTGGLNLKPGSSMGLMKKDMGGAATVLALAHMIMASKLNVRLRVLLPIAENAVSGDAFRPGDILTSRKKLTVEVNNTDAEGRLVLADALCFADEGAPDLIISMATLTGAARVAVGPDISPFFATKPQDAEHVKHAGNAVFDPVWELPFHTPYEAMIEPGIADLDNAPAGGFAGSITAALFLRRFVTNTPRYMHFDIYGWNPTSAPARPKGGVAMGARAIFHALPNMLIR